MSEKMRFPCETNYGCPLAPPPEAFMMPVASDECLAARSILLDVLKEKIAAKQCPVRQLQLSNNRVRRTAAYVRDVQRNDTPQ